MNEFVNKFGERMKRFWEADDWTDEDDEILLNDILNYANSNPSNFIDEFSAIQFSKDINALSIVLEALAKDTGNWGQFYIDMLDKIFTEARLSKNADEVLEYLDDFVFITNDRNPFIQKIVDRLHKELQSDRFDFKMAVISQLPYYMRNTSVRNKQNIIDDLQKELTNKNWKIRYNAFLCLYDNDLLPQGYKLSFIDKIRSKIFKHFKE